MELRNIPIVGLEKYQISDTGMLFNIKKNTFRQGAIHKTGYVIYTFGGKGKQKAYTAHRLVALAFIPNPHNLPQINHINGIKHDNNVTNLEWVTQSENNLHSIRVLGNKPKNTFQKGNKAGKRLRCEVVKGLKPGIYESFKEAGKNNNIDGSNLLKIARGVFKSSVFMVNILDY